MHARGRLGASSRHCAGAAIALALLLAGCSADLALFGADRAWWSGGREATPLSMASAPADSLVAPDGLCSPGPEQAPRGIGLGMTECDLIRFAGPTDRIEIGVNERGQRTAVIAYPDGERAGIYRFTSGVLVSVARAPEPPPRTPQRARPR